MARLGGYVWVERTPPQAPQEAARAAVATGQLRTGRRLRAAMWMPQVAGMARPPSLDSGKDNWARKVHGAAWSCSTTSFLHDFQRLPFQPAPPFSQLKVKPGGSASSGLGDLGRGECHPG